MAVLELSRWPTLQIGKGPPEKTVEIFVIDPLNTPADVRKMAKESGLTLDVNGVFNLLVKKDGNSARIFILLSSKSPKSQRGILNRILEKFKTFSKDGRAFSACNFDIRTDIFKLEALESFMLSLYEFSRFKLESNLIKDIFVSCEPFPDMVPKIKKISEVLPWVYFAQDMVNYPPSHKPPETLSDTITEQLGGLADVSFTQWKDKELEVPFNPVWAVGKGSRNKPMVLRIEYCPEDKINNRPVVIIGKGVCFDSGGLNSKIGPELDEMKLDMAGAVAAAGVVGCASVQRWPLHIIAYLPLVQNLLTADSILTSDVVSVPIVKEPKEKKDFEYIQISDTDAEGRLLLCSLTSHAVLNDDPDLIVTVATLCGSTEGMLGSYAAAAISKVKKLLDNIEAAGFSTDEIYALLRITPDVLDECQTDMEGDITTWRNYNNDLDNGDSLMAFGLIQNFAGNVPFLHLDICGVAWLRDSVIYKSKKRRASGATGWGVRSISEFLKRYYNLLTSVKDP